MTFEEWIESLTGEPFALEHEGFIGSDMKAAYRAGQESVTNDLRDVDIVFDGPPSHDSGRFVEVECPPGKGVSFGEWVERDDGYWALRFRAALPPEDDDE